MTDCFELLSILATIVIVAFGLTVGFAVLVAFCQLAAVGNGALDGGDELRRASSAL